MSRSYRKEFCSFDLKTIREYRRTGLMDWASKPGMTPEEHAQRSTKYYHHIMGGNFWNRPSSRFKRSTRRQDRARIKDGLIRSTRLEMEAWGFTASTKKRVKWEWY